ncbi:MAG: nucleoside deaminase [Planctomycetota bacterium]
MTDQPNEPAATELDREMMRRALELADRAGEEGEVPVGAVVYDASGAIIGTGRNRREVDRAPQAHAEFLAIVEACRAIGDWRLNNYALAVTLEPCPMCAGLIVNARVGRVVYGASDPKAGAVRSLYTLLEDRRLNHRAEVIAGVMADEASAQLKSFFAKLRKG